MRNRECRLTSRLSIEAAAGTLDAAGRQHLDSCQLCREALLVGDAMRQLASITEKENPMPPADVIWVRSRLLDRKKLVVQAARPVAFFENLAYGVISAGWIAFLIFQWPLIQSWLTGIQIDLAEGFRTSHALPLSFFWTFAALSVITAVVMLHRVEAGARG
jgi:predicted anti-sigma-YlaC factor YlaD